MQANSEGVSVIDLTPTISEHQTTSKMHLNVQNVFYDARERSPGESDRLVILQAKT